jgi:DNA-binding response OmpR family regulator
VIKGNNLSNSLSTKKRILCAEDDEDSCELIGFLLAEYEVVFADNIKKAVELFETEHFDLCLLDNWLIDGLGIDLCRQIRALNPTVPIIFASGVGQKEEIQKALDAGAQAYLVKPYFPEELQKIVKELIEQSPEHWRIQKL